MSKPPKLRLLPAPPPPNRVAPLPELPDAAELAKIIQMHCGRAPPAELLDGRAGLRGTMEQWHRYFDRTPMLPDENRWLKMAEATPDETPLQVTLRFMEQEKVRPRPTEPKKNPFAEALEAFARQMRAAAAADFPPYLQDVEELLEAIRKAAPWLSGESAQRLRPWISAALAMKSTILAAFGEAGLKAPSQRRLAETLKALLVLLGQHFSIEHIRKTLWVPNDQEKVQPTLPAEM
jgi:hypothetical protein